MLDQVAYWFGYLLMTVGGILTLWIVLSIIAEQAAHKYRIWAYPNTLTTGMSTKEVIAAINVARENKGLEKWYR